MVPAVVVNSSLNALGVVRSLANGGMPIHLVTTTRRSPAAWSRFCSIQCLPSLSGRDLVHGLIELAAKIGARPVLILTSDPEVETVSMYQAELEACYHINLPPRALISSLADKANFQELAVRLRLPVPRGIAVRSVADLPLVRSLTLPAVIKPSDKTSVLHGRVERAVRVETFDQAWITAARMLERCQCVVVQEWIDGADTDIFFTLFTCNSRGDVVSMFTGRKVVCDPPDLGSTAVCVAAPEAAAEAEALTRDFIAQVGYRGLGSMEYKRDRRTGQLVIVEPTVGRTDWQEEIATLCGENIPLAAYWSELENAPKPSGRVSRSVAWRASIEFSIPRGALPARTRTVDGHLRLGDPAPGVYHYMIDRFALRAYRLATRFLRRFRDAVLV